MSALDRSSSQPTPSPARNKRRPRRARKGAAPPVLVEARRGDVVESQHRGHIVQVGASGEVERAIGDPATVVMLRSTIKPFGLVAFVESGAADDLALTRDELAVMAGSHTGEDKHVRTLQAILRRASVTQALLTCGTEGMPLDERTKRRLLRDGETPGPIRHACSGYHAAGILMSRFAGWSVEGYSDRTHPSQVAIRDTVARLFGQKPARLRTGTGDCGLATYAFPLEAVARAYLLLADPEGATDDARRASVPALTRIRDAMMAAPDLVGGTYDDMDTELMRRRPGLLVSDRGGEGLRGIGLVRGAGTRGPAPAGIAVSIEDGDGARRAGRAASVEALAQMRTLDERDLRALAAFHHPITLGPDGSEVAVAVPRFELAPLNELA